MSANNGKRKPRRRVRIRLEDDAEDVGYPHRDLMLALFLVESWYWTIPHNRTS